MGPENIWSDPEGPKHEARWIGPSGTYIAKGDRGLAWRGALGSPALRRFKSDGDAESVYMCERHHILLVDELLYGEGGRSYEGSASKSAAPYYVIGGCMGLPRVQPYWNRSGDCVDT